MHLLADRRYLVQYLNRRGSIEETRVCGGCLAAAELPAVVATRRATSGECEVCGVLAG